MAFRRYTPPNLPSLSQQDRVAWAGLTAYLPEFESQIRSRYLTFADLTERDEYFTDPEHGDTCLVNFHTDPGTGFDVGATLWVYSQWLSPSFNVVDAWLPYDMQWNDFAITSPNCTIGNGAGRARYRRQGAHCSYELGFTHGSTTVIVASPNFDLPFAGVDAIGGFGNGGTMGQCFLRTATVSSVGIALYGTASTDTCLVQYVVNAAGPPARLINASINATTPFTWVAGDVWTVTDFNYEMDIENTTFTS